MSKRKQLQDQRNRQKQISQIALGTGLVILAVVIGYFVWTWATTPSPTAEFTSDGIAAAVEALPVDPDRSHIGTDTDPGQFNSNPPTSGHHYATWLDAGFFDSNKYTYPQGYLVHNLEHGYIIFWYNCKALSDSDCEEMKTKIKAVMKWADNFKVIAYPWDLIDTPVVLTSWGYRQSMTKFDSKAAATFVQEHRNRAPEPDAP